MDMELCFTGMSLKTKLFFTQRWIGFSQSKRKPVWRKCYVTICAIGIFDILFFLEHSSTYFFSVCFGEKQFSSSTADIQNSLHIFFCLQDKIFMSRLLTSSKFSLPSSQKLLQLSKFSLPLDQKFFFFFKFQLPSEIIHWPFLYIIQRGLLW